MIENNQLLIKKYNERKHKAKRFILEVSKDSNLLYLTKTALKRTSNVIFNMKIVDFDES